MNGLFYRILLALVFSAAILQPNSAKKPIGIVKDTIEINNPYFQVLRNSSFSQASDSSMLTKRILVALNELKIRTADKTILLQRGQIAVFQSNETYQVEYGQYFEVGIKKHHPAPTQPEQWIEPAKNTLLYDDAEIRVFEERLAPHDIREIHSHTQRVVVRLNLVQLTDPRFHETPKPGTGIQLPNTVKYAEPVVHVVKNTSDIPLFNIVIEYKI